MKARLLDLPSLLHDLVRAEDVGKDLAVRKTTEAVALSKHLGDGKSIRPAAKKVIPNTDDRSDGQIYFGTGDLAHDKLTYWLLRARRVVFLDVRTSTLVRVSLNA